MERVASLLQRITWLFTRTDDHTQERVRRMSLTGLSAMVATGTIMFVGFISVPLTVGYLGPERYGLWITISSLLNWLIISDVGFNSALVNVLAEADGQDDPVRAQGLVATTFWVLLGIALLIALIAVVLVPLVDWPDFFQVQGVVDTQEVVLSVWLALLIFCLTFPTNMVHSVYRGYQTEYKANLWEIAASVLSLINLVIVVQFEAGLPLLILALLGTRMAVRLVNMFVLLRYDYPWLWPAPHMVSMTHLRRLWGLGGFYLLQQIGNIGMLQSQPIILTRLIGPVAAGSFAVSYRLLHIPRDLLLVLLGPFIASYGEARARGDWPWMRRTLLWKTAGSVLLTLVLTLPLALLSPLIITYWADPALVPDMMTIVWLALFTIISGLASPLAVFVQGLERANHIAMLTIANGIATILLSFWLVPWMGMAGMALAMVLALAFISTTYVGALSIYLLRHGETPAAAAASQPEHLGDAP
ncbi:MAG: lipopolysaccharide biosynthesis protein [Chloroflexaceae bacterium]|nr:lipopolysaccharide biosynthesis protein [Chloroflexaceae bacterium]